MLCPFKGAQLYEQILSHSGLLCRCPFLWSGSMATRSTYCVDVQGGGSGSTHSTHLCMLYGKSLEPYTANRIIHEKECIVSSQLSMLCNSYVIITSLLITFDSGYVESVDSQEQSPNN